MLCADSHSGSSHPAEKMVMIIRRISISVGRYDEFNALFVLFRIVVVESSGGLVLIHYLRVGGRLWQEIGKIWKYFHWQGWRSVGVTGLVEYHGAVRGFRSAGCRCCG